jgi:hypothetical protein
VGEGTFGGRVRGNYRPRTDVASESISELFRLGLCHRWHIIGEESARDASFDMLNVGSTLGLY